MATGFDETPYLRGFTLPLIKTEILKLEKSIADEDPANTETIEGKKATLVQLKQRLKNLEDYELRKSRSGRKLSIVTTSYVSEKRKIEVAKKEKLLVLRHEYENEKDELEFKIQITNSGPDCTGKDLELDRLRIMLDRVEKSYKRRSRQLEEETQLQYEKLQEDDYQNDLSDNDDLESTDSKNPGEMQGDNDYRKDDENENEVKDDDKRTFGYGQDNAPDKDTMMMYLMQTQLNMMQKSSGSFAERKLPEFHGDPKDWSNFKSTFERTNKKYQLDDGENMSRIQAALKGEARQAVEHLMANVLNVSKILEILERRYGRPEFIIDCMIEKIKTSAKVELMKPKTVVDFGTAVENLVATVTAYKEQDYLASKQLVTELIEKLPGPLKDKWYSFLYQDPKRRANLKSFAKWIEEPVGIALLQMKPTATGTKSEEKPSPKGKYRGSVNTIDNDEKAVTQQCQVCNLKGHLIDTCWSLKKKSMDERWKLVKEAKVCFYCLKEGHITGKCTEAKECGKDGCTRKHHHLLHTTFKNKGSAAAEQPKKTENSEKSEEKSESVIAMSESVIEGTDGPLPIVPVRIRGNGGRTKIAYALLDSGASRTLIDKHLANDLRLNGETFTYAYRTVGGKTVTNNDAMKINFEVSGKYRHARMWQISNAVAVNNIGLAKYSLNVEKAKLQWPYLQRYNGPSMTGVTPQIIIGGDHGFLLMHRDLLFRNEDEPVGMRTVLGWILQGKLADVSSPGTTCYIGGSDMDNIIHDLIRESFKFDHFIDSIPGVTALSREDKKALHIMNNTARQLDDGRWEIGHLWKSPEPFIQDGYQEALTRLTYTEKRMRRDEEFAKVYKLKIEEYLQKEYIKKLTLEEVAKVNEKTRYVSHFGVKNLNKPGKFRLVFDAAEKVSGECLNDQLLTGPDLLKSLPVVIWNFRRHPVVICGDIEDMFHRVYIRKEDRNAQRFLWRDGDSTRDPDIYEMRVMIFGATSSPSCAIFIKNKNAEKYAETYPLAVEAIIEDTYCDDNLTGTKTVEEAILLRQQIVHINASGGFEIKKWISNSQDVMDSIPPKERLNGNRQIGSGDLELERVLGLWWNPVEDEFSFVVKFNKVKPEILNGRRPTKREACSLVMSLYDPIGFIAHFKIKGMIILQRVWISEVGWDQPITETVFEDWKLFLEELPRLREMRIPRCYSVNLESAEVQLHTLVDSSTEGFCAISFIRIEHTNGVEVAFINANVKVAPIKKKTIPRLELDAAVLGVKMANKILKGLRVNVRRTYFWTDSMTVLHWIRSESSRYKEYVANRIGTIQEASNISDWRWVPTELNVADDATRLKKQSDFSPTSRWLNGPAFLKDSVNMWPKEDIGGKSASVIASAACEVLGDAAGVGLSVNERCGLAAGENVDESITIPDASKFSSYFRYIRATAAVRAAGAYWYARLRKRKCETPWKLEASGIVSSFPAEHVIDAEKAVLRDLQLNLCHQKVNHLFPFRDEDGIVRVKGRLGNAMYLGADTKNPILLPMKHFVVDMIIDDEHRRNCHTGRNTVYNNLRQKYWIQNGRHEVRKSWTRCRLCQIRKAKPVIPEMGALPSMRMNTNVPPFSFTGVDCFGPYEVAIGRRREKRWGVLFTDMVMRAIHLDVAASCSADDMMLVISRFVDSRGLPRQFLSDNATNFRAVAKEVEKRRKYQGAEWKFIPASSPHMGGAWETMVKETKRVLSNIFQEKCPREQVLITALKAVENIVNSRPLCYVSGDLDDPASLTPNHFLRGVGAASNGVDAQSVQCGSEYFGGDVGDDKERWGKMWEKSQVLANKFWEQWRTSVLPTLLRRNKWTNTKEPVQLGDVIIMVDDMKPRNNWTKAVVTKTFPGTDGIVRVVEVTVRNPETKTCTSYKRAVAKVCPIGVRCDLAILPGVAKSGGRK